MIDTLPALMNSLKMIHTIARHYGTAPRMTGLLGKVADQMIRSCKGCVDFGGNGDVYIYVCAHASQQSDTDTKRSPYQRTNHHTTQVAPRRRARGRALGAGPPGAGAAAGGLHQGVCRVYVYFVHVCVPGSSHRGHTRSNQSQHQQHHHPQKNKHSTAVPGVSGAVPRGAGQAAADAQGQAVRLPRAPHLRPLRGPSSLGVFVCV